MCPGHFWSVPPGYSYPWFRFRGNVQCPCLCLCLPLSPVHHGRSGRLRQDNEMAPFRLQPNLPPDRSRRSQPRHLDLRRLRALSRRLGRRIVAQRAHTDDRRRRDNRPSEFSRLLGRRARESSLPYRFRHPTRHNTGARNRSRRRRLHQARRSR